MIEVRRLGLADPEPEFLVIGADIHSRLTDHPRRQAEVSVLLAQQRAGQIDGLMALLRLDPDIAAFQRLDPLGSGVELGDELRRRRSLADIAAWVGRIDCVGPWWGTTVSSQQSHKAKD